VPAAGAHETLVRLAVDNEPAESQPYAERHHEDKAGLEKPLATQRKDTSPASVAPESNVVTIGETELRGVPEQRAAPAKTADSSTQPHTSDSAVAVPSSTEIVQEVLAWMANSDGATERVNPTVSGAPSSPALPVQVVAVGSSTQRQFDDSSTSPTPGVSPSERSPEPETGHVLPASPPPSTGTEPWSVHIDTIHLTIEEPPAKPEPRSVEPRAVPAAQPSQSRFSPSRLRRHYVRTF
jgi:hypothetical protein